MTKLNELNLIDAMRSKVLIEKIPTIGICLGAQLMCRCSEEGILPGLSWIDGVVKKFPTQINGTKYTVPHMGWDVVNISKTANYLPTCHCRHDIILFIPIISNVKMTRMF